jgi:hypothetical protein
MIQTTTRNADLTDLVEMLRTQQTRKHDIVVPAGSLRSQGGILVVDGAEQEITPDGVTSVDGRYLPTSVCDEGISQKLAIPRAYLRRMREQRPDLYDANVNGWLHGGDETGVDTRSFLLRTFRGDDGEVGIARALLSDTYKMIDNIDVLMTVLDGVRAAGVDVIIKGADLTERRMRVRIAAPEVQALAPTLLAGYRSPYSGGLGDANPTVFAGLEISNSEVGNGALSIVPRLVVQICNNGMTMTKDAMRSVHLGGRLETGVINWSEDTQEANLALVRSKTKDAVETFLNVDYMKGAIERLEAKAAEEVASVDAVRDITKGVGMTDTQVDSILSFFIKGGQTTLGGVANAITGACQQEEDGDVAAEMEAAATAILL